MSVVAPTDAASLDSSVGPAVVAATAQCDVFRRHLQRLHQQHEAANGSGSEETTATAVVDEKLQAVIRTQQSEAMQTVLEFLCSSPGVACALLDAVWADASVRLAALTAHQQQAKQVSPFSEDSDNAKSRPSKKKSRGGKLPTEQQQRLTHQRETIRLEKAIWIDLESVRLIAQMVRAEMAQSSALLPASTLQVADSILIGVAQLLTAPFVQSHAIAVRVVDDISMLSLALRANLQAWCRSSLSIAPGDGLPARWAALTPDPRPLCALIKAIVTAPAGEHDQQAFEQCIWETAVQVLHESPSVLLRQSVLRVLLPSLLGVATGTGDRSRLRQLSVAARDQWRLACAHAKKVGGSNNDSASFSVSSSPLLAPAYFATLTSTQPQLDLLFDLLCAHYAHFVSSVDDDSERRELDEWVMDVVLVGLSSGASLVKKQCLYLLQTRQLLKMQTGAADTADSTKHTDADAGCAADYTPDEWSCFHHLFGLLEGVRTNTKGQDRWQSECKESECGRLTPAPFSSVMCTCA